MRHWKLFIWFTCMVMLAVVTNWTYSSDTYVDLTFRAELSSDSTNRPTGVIAVFSYGSRVDTVTLITEPGGDSLLWTTPDSLPDTIGDSSGFYDLTYYVTYMDTQTIPYQFKLLARSPSSASISETDKQQIAGYVGDTLTGRGFWGPGTGLNACSVLVLDTSVSTAVAGVTVQVLNAARQYYTVNASLGDGYAHFNLNNGTWYLKVSKLGYVFGTEDTLTVSGVLEDTVSGYVWDPGTAPNPYQAIAYGWFYGIDGSGKSGILVTAELNLYVVRRGDAVVSGYRMSDTTDTAGYWALTLINNDSLNPLGTEYKFKAVDSSRTVAHVSRAITGNTVINWGK